ncbi:unnamed protein product, partial [Scytosiphon promiscuus]
MLQDHAPRKGPRSITFTSCPRKIFSTYYAKYALLPVKMCCVISRSFQRQCPSDLVPADPRDAVKNENSENVPRAGSQLLCKTNGVLPVRIRSSLKAFHFPSQYPSLRSNRRARRGPFLLLPGIKI